MPGLTKEIIRELDADRSLRRIRSDIPSDFIVSHHYGAILTHASEELYEEVAISLASGNFEPRLPITIEVPRATGITRPGTILPPHDRLVYQLLVDDIAARAELMVDRSRCFSNELLTSDTENRMFANASEGWRRMRQRIQDLSRDPHNTHALRADVTSYFEGVDQHALVNLLSSSGCEPATVKLLEKLLSSWRERSSRGILQGMYPSDFLGNVYLSGIDAEFEIRGIASVRYVDDIFAFFSDIDSARRGLVVLNRQLRKDGLHLNAGKTSILSTAELLYEETELDRLFQQATDEALTLLTEDTEPELGFYGLSSSWKTAAPVTPCENQVEIRAIEELYKRAQESTDSDRIEKFCFPLLGAAGSTVAVERAIRGLRERPHLAKVYASYLWRVALEQQGVSTAIQEHATRGLPYEWQMQWVMALLFESTRIDTEAVKAAQRLIADSNVASAARAVAVQVVAKHGTAVAKRWLRTRYNDEPSEYVRSSILYAARFFPKGEKKAVIRAWGRHSLENVLLARVLAKAPPSEA